MNIKKHVRISGRRALLNYLLGCGLFLILLLLIPLDNPLFPENYGTVIRDTDGKMLRVYLNEEQQWYLPPEEGVPVPQKLAIAITCFEDRFFYAHPGVNIPAVLRALSQNLLSGRTTSGASTISMQVVRLMRPKERIMENKLLELFQALKLELLFSKEDIMRMYVTNAPYGGNIIGYQSASQRYFGKDPNELSWGEAAMLAVLPNSPAIVSPDLDPLRLLEKRDRLLEQLMEAEIIDQKTLELAKGESIATGSIPFPVIAPQLADRLHAYPNTG
ncbi:MAG: penicillin-binding protein 1C, partial [Spirochaetaceae bacterium]